METMECNHEGENLKELLKKIERAKQEWEQSMDCIDDLVFVVDGQGLIKRCNRPSLDLFKISFEDILGSNLNKLCLENGIQLPADAEQHEVFHGPSSRWFNIKQYPKCGDKDTSSGGGTFNRVIIFHEITLIRKISRELERKNRQLQDAYEELKATQSKIVHQEKMASIGQLAAGVAHEINNPVGFISSNIGTLKKYTDRMVEFINAQTTALESLQALEQVKDIRKKLKLDYIIEDIGELIKESLDGVDRVKNIVQNLKSFSRVDDTEEKLTDINECMETTLNIIWNELKYKATVHKKYGDLPLIKCYPQQLNQVFMNLLVNAAQAIEKQGDITICTRTENDFIKVSIADTGSGIPKDKINKIFDPFFTTKEVGKGTGLGLSICYDIVKKHKGEITVDSVVGQGTTFTVILPKKDARG
jgi:two-component system NtrC family sensor kinase